MQEFQLYSNEQLFELLRCSDERAFTEIFFRYDKRIYKFIFKMVKDDNIATDITQEVFIKIWKKRELLVDIHNAEAYIFTIASNLTLNQIKKSLREAHIKEMLQTIQRQNNAYNADNTLLLHDSEALILDIVEALPPQQKRIYQLSREQGLNYNEISSTMKISSNTVRNHLVKALHTIRTRIEKQDQIILFLIFILSLY
ncbi:RNA polymerase sigma factor [Arachidicoccus soli]|uniref:RNA polymerase sigma-70 factor n=1 Tax=Arachidicoccus soli TaxID=2341117 RepID=A0A386HQ65_9BACT|nr:RNA polymerase sigma-70 factor [Arachidicoccus soli]AYD48088.1 RNA polymerase sigma-70 factor [Arachidicoccus soli]